mgnify:CR=1 FL=1
MKVVKFDEVTEYEGPTQPARRIRILATPESVGTKNISAGISIYGLGMSAPWHTHEGEEMIFVIHGKGKFRTKTQETEAITGTVIYFPPGEEHQLENTGSQSLEFIFVYAPPGRETLPIQEKWIPHRP